MCLFFQQRRIQLHRPARSGHGAAHGQQTFQCAFDKCVLRAVDFVQAGGEQTFRFKRNGGYLRKGVSGFRLDNSGFMGHYQQSHVNGIAVVGPTMVTMTEKTLVGQDRSPAQRLQ